VVVGVREDEWNTAVPKVVGTIDSTGEEVGGGNVGLRWGNGGFACMNSWFCPTE
jgi:hypothetical protein